MRRKLTPLATPIATRVAPLCDTKKQKLFDKNTQYHSGWQRIDNAVIHSSILVSSIRSLLAIHIFSFLTRLSNAQSVKG